MNNPYMPVEKDIQLTKKSLEVINEFKFPIHIITKSDLVTRDIDTIKEIGKTYSAVSFTVTTIDDDLSSKIEPAASISSKRFTALNKLAKSGIYSGITLMPILPFLTDSEENIGTIIKKSKDNGANYILCYPGMTLREGQREYFYKQLDILFPGIKEKYIKKYGSSYSCNVPDFKKIYNFFYEICEKESIPVKMNFYIPNKDTQLELF